MSAPFRLVQLADQDRSALRCGEEALDRYFQTQVTQDIKRRVANCFVAVETDTETVAGYYTLSSASVALSDLPADTAKRLPRYPTVPAVRMGRLAVDKAFQGRGLGAALLADAVLRTIKAGPASVALIVDAKNESAMAFYAHHGFISFASQPKFLFLPIATAAKELLGAADLAAASG